MIIHKLDRHGQRITGSRRQPATRTIGGVPHYHYEIRYDLPPLDGRRQQRMKRLWLPSDDAARDYAERLCQLRPATLTWLGAWELFR